MFYQEDDNDSDGDNDDDNEDENDDDNEDDNEDDNDDDNDDDHDDNNDDDYDDDNNDDNDNTIMMKKIVKNMKLRVTIVMSISLFPHFIDLSLLLLPLFVGSVQVEHLHAVDEVVDLLHEVVQEDGLAEAHAEILDLGGEGVELGEVSELGAVREVKQEVGQVWTPGGGVYNKGKISKINILMFKKH